MNELKSCPFCGTVPQEMNNEDRFCNSIENGFSVGCDECGATGPMPRTPGMLQSMSEAIESWNVRAIQDCKKLNPEDDSSNKTCTSCGLIGGYHKYYCHWVVDHPESGLVEISKRTLKASLLDFKMIGMVKHFALSEDLAEELTNYLLKHFGSKRLPTVEEIYKWIPEDLSGSYILYPSKMAIAEAIHAEMSK